MDHTKEALARIEARLGSIDRKIERVLEIQGAQARALDKLIEQTTMEDSDGEQHQALDGTPAGEPRDETSPL